MLRFLVKLAVIYCLIGVFYGLAGEFRVAAKYGTPLPQTLLNPFMYIRVVSFCGVWPEDMYWSYQHCGNMLGCPVELSK
jgi:hypothetical protein